MQHPIYLQSIGMPPTSAQVLPKGSFEWAATQSYSNVYERVIFPDVDINLDMEIYRPALEGKMGIGKGWEIGFELPFLKFFGGVLDEFVQGFHNSFGLPNGGRELASNGEFSYEVRSPDFGYEVGAKNFGVGDLTLQTKYRFFHAPQKGTALAFAAALKLPSGDETEGLGSGSPGFGIGVTAEQSYKRARGFFNLRFLVDGGPEALQSYWHSHQLLISLAGELRLWKTLSAVVQIDGGTPLLNNIDFETWHGIPMDLIMGLNGRYKNWFAQIAFTEDISAVGPSIDFTTFLKIGSRFDL